MARTIFIVLFALTALSSFAYAGDDNVDDCNDDESVETCGDNESMNICGRQCEGSCISPFPSRRLCPLSACSNATAGCRCDSGYYRDSITDECVLAKDCSPTSTPDDCCDNESMNLCGRLCEPTCANPNPRICPRIACTKATAACRCDSGYYRDSKTGKCVAADDCIPTSTKPPIVCGKNEQLGNCGRICEGTCKNPSLEKCAATSCTGSGCQCKEGYLRSEANDLCVLPNQCPPKKCKHGEILAACGRTCEGTCASPTLPEICTRIKCANQSCRCDLDSGYVRNPDTDECIRIQDCNCATKPKCPPHSELAQCGRMCEPTCQDPRERLCKINALTCKSACRCVKGYVRDEVTSLCVKPDRCCRSSWQPKKD